MAVQMIKRRVFDDSGTLIREGMAPKDVPNTRPDLMAYWTQEDKINAEKEAEKAAKAAVSEKAGPSAEELVKPLQDRLGQVELRLGVADRLVAATPDEVLAGTMAIQRAAGAAALVNAAAETTIARVEAVAAEANSQLAAIEGQVLQSADAVGSLLADSRLRLDEVSSEMLAKTTAAISKRIAGLEVQAAQLRGPKGSRGRVGQGLCAGAGKRPEVRPDGSEWSPGDSWLDTKAEGFQLQYLDADGNWSKPARLVPEPKLIQATVNQIDQAPRVSASFSSSGGSGGGVGGGERLLTRSLTFGTKATLASAGNWRGATPPQDPKSGTLFLELTGASGAHIGERGYLSAAFALGKDPTKPVETVFAIVGDLFDVFQVTLEVKQEPVKLPAGLGLTRLPTGTLCTTVSAAVGLAPGASAAGDGGTKSFSVGGVILWALEATGNAVSTSGAVSIQQPQWVWQ